VQSVVKEKKWNPPRITRIYKDLKFMVLSLRACRIIFANFAVNGFGLKKTKTFKGRSRRIDAFSANQLLITLLNCYLVAKNFRISIPNFDPGQHPFALSCSGNCI